MVRRLCLLLLLGWLAGFLWFALDLPGPRPEARTDGVIVLTGSRGRIERGIDVLRQGWARKMLVSGVYEQVKPAEFRAQFKVPRKLMECCITLWFEAVDTRSNARESARWIARNHMKSVRMITTDWHMRRAAFELDQMKPPGVTIVRDAVPSNPGWRTLFIEYHKYLARRAAQLWGG